MFTIVITWMTIDAKMSDSFALQWYIVHSRKQITDSTYVLTRNMFCELNNQQYIYLHTKPNLLKLDMIPWEFCSPMNTYGGPHLKYHAWVSGIDLTWSVGAGCQSSYHIMSNNANKEITNGTVFIVSRCYVNSIITMVWMQNGAFLWGTFIDRITRKIF